MNTISKWSMRVIVLLGLSVFLWSCTKERPDKPIPEYPHHTWGQNQQFFPTKETMGSPTFNPANPYEIAGCRGYFKDTIGEFLLYDIGLVIYNLKTKEYHEIYRAPFLSSPRWGANGWIVFESGSRIWKIKPSGDSLTRLTNFPSFDPEWNKKGDKIIYVAWIGSDVVSIVADSDGNHLDTVAWRVYNNGTWRHDSLTACSRSSTGLTIGNPSTNTWETLDTTDYNRRLASRAVWTDDHTIVYGCGPSFWKMNTQTKKKTHLLDTHLAQQYRIWDYSEKLDKVLVERADFRKKDTVNNEINLYIDVAPSYFLMNPDGTGMELLDLPFN